MATKAKYADRDSILNVVDFETREVYVPEWKMTVRVRSMTADERDELENPMAMAAARGKEASLANFRARLMALTVVTEDGERMFSVEDAAALGKKRASAVDRIATVAMELSGITNEDLDELGKDTAPTNDTDSVSS